MKSIVGLAVVVLRVAASRAPRADVMSWTPAGGDTTCSPVRNIDSVLVRGRITLFGELHGTDALPAFVGNVLCHAWRRRLPATLAVELASESSGNLDGYVHSPADSATAMAALLADSVWHGSPPDGRTSLAMARLLGRTRELARAGADVRVVAFSRPSTPTRDSTMAVELARALARDTSRVVVILTGNIHSRVTVGVSFDSTFRPMAMRLRALVQPRRVVGLDASHRGGTAWVCLSDGTPCGAHQLKAHELIPLGGIELGPVEKGYDGVYSAGAITASPPAVTTVRPSAGGTRR